MYIEDFISGNYESGYKFKYFVPAKINHNWQWNDAAISKLLEEAAHLLGELNSLARYTPNINLFIQLHVTKESVISSRIEGTKTKIDEALYKENEIELERRDDWREVKNYTEALNATLKEMEKLPISTPLLKYSHKILMKGVRGANKLPGEFRKSQNWLGGAAISDAVFIPPAHHLIDDLMSDLEKFIHNDKINVPNLIKIAIAHYQFETIHPFLDGNGRIGRLLITLFLIEKKLLTHPVLYISSFFERNRQLYYDKLANVRVSNDLKNWLKYFLTGIIEVSFQSIETLEKIIKLKKKIEKEISGWQKRTKSAEILKNHIFEKPVIRVKDVQTLCGLTPKSAGSLIQKFEEKKYLKEITDFSRNRIFIFKPYIDLFDK